MSSPRFTKQRFQIAFFGIGGIGHVHLHHALAAHDVDICAIADVNKAAIDSAIDKIKAARPTGPAIETSLDGLKFADMVNCDYAVVLIPNPVRIPIVKRLLERGIPVLMEKPASHTWADYETMLSAATKSGATCMVSQNYRFDPSARLIRQLIRNGDIGQVQTIHGRFQRNHRVAGDLIYGTMPGPIPFRVEMLIHHFDMVLSWIDSPQEAILSSGFRTGTTWGIGDTGADVLATFKNGARMAYHGDWATSADLTSFNGHWIVTGSKGVISWQDGPISLRRAHPTDSKQPFGDQVTITPTASDSFAAAAMEFRSALREGREPESSLAQNGRSLRLCLEASQCADLG